MMEFGDPAWLRSKIKEVLHVLYPLTIPTGAYTLEAEGLREESDRITIYRSDPISLRKLWEKPTRQRLSDEIRNACEKRVRGPWAFEIRGQTEDEFVRTH